MLSDEVQSRLLNFKFKAALEYAHRNNEELSEDEANLMEALSNVLGDPGWFDGHLAFIVTYALMAIGVDRDKEMMPTFENWNKMQRKERKDE